MIRSSRQDVHGHLVQAALVAQSRPATGDAARSRIKGHRFLPTGSRKPARWWPWKCPLVATASARPSRRPEPDFPTVPAVSADASDPGSLVRSGSVTAKLARNWWGVVECAAQVMRGVTGLGQRGGGPNNDPLRNDNDQGSEGRRWSCGRPVCGSPCGTSPAFNLKFRHARRTGWATMLPSQRMTVASRSSRTASAGCIPAIFALMASACDRIPAPSAPGPKTRQSRRG